MCPHCDVRMTVHNDYFMPSLPTQQPNQCAGGVVDANLQTWAGMAASTITTFATPCFRLDRDNIQDRNSFANSVDHIKEANPVSSLYTKCCQRSSFCKSHLGCNFRCRCRSHSSDFRAEEKMGQLLIGAAGRSS